MLLNNTIFDDVFRTLCEKNPKLLIPLINEIFHTDYSMDEEITLLSGEHHSLDDLKEVITDSAIRIKDHTYHIECQSRPDGSMLIRMIEYDFHIALEQAAIKDDTCEMDFPYSAVLYLRHTKNTPDCLFMKINFPNGEHVKYEIPVIKTQVYTKEDILSKKLFFLVPFFILKYENQPLNTKESIAKLEQDFLTIEKGLQKAYDEHLINDYDKTNINELTIKLVNYLMKNNEPAKKGVSKVMGGQVIETYADKILKMADAKIKEGEKKLKEEERKFKEEKRTIILRMQAKGFSSSEISDFTGYEPSFVKEVLSSTNPNKPTPSISNRSNRRSGR